MHPRLLNALAKLAADEHEEFLNEHFTEMPRWQEFQRNLRSKSFVQAVKDDPRADKKLQRFAENIGRHKQSKGVPSFQVPSQSSGKNYTVKYHPDIDRYTCNCGDWNYARSWRRGQKTKDCKHIRMVQLELKAQGTTPLVKKAFERLSNLIYG